MYSRLTGTLEELDLMILWSLSHRFSCMREQSPSSTQQCLSTIKGGHINKEFSCSPHPSTPLLALFALILPRPSCCRASLPNRSDLAPDTPPQTTPRAIQVQESPLEASFPTHFRARKQHAREKQARRKSRFSGVSADPSGRWEAYVYCSRRKM